MRSFAYRLYLLFVISWFLHLGSRIPALGVLRLDLLLVLVISAILIATPAEEAATETRTRRMIAILIIYALVTVPFVEWPGSALKNGLPSFIKAAVFYFFTAGLITSESRLRGLMMAFMVCQSIRVLEPVYLHVTQGYWGSLAYMAGGEASMDRLAGAPSDVINPNGLAYVVLTVISFTHFLATASWPGRLAYVGLLPLCLYALVLTGSRSGLVGLAIVIAAIWLKSRHKIVMALVLVAGVLVSLPRLSADIQDRYLSIVSSDTQNAATAAGRIDAMWMNFEVAMRRPFFGHGLGTSREANANFAQSDLPAHNLYAEVAQELGFVGLVLFVWMMVGIVLTLRRTIQPLKAKQMQSSLLGRLTDAVETFLWTNILFSFASYGLTSYEWYFIAGLTEVNRLLTDKAAVTEPSTVAAEVPLPRWIGPPARAGGALRRPSLS